ncbi:hypothetical protein DNAM5_152 [Haloarcula californiae tailed virus 1]|uniref:Uncharacterized protein n=1 Tax=Haloarcula californiae tailed virus 1 TaxID=1273746 RepID=R4T8A5_9CAUD|nr:hypothetical protein M202_gp069 [Haloarcula californiae tailed virus 1]AGM12009.1 hypothetical protein DNAM5_152 [Haloarcula californiae tailed virus 1]
MTINDVTVYDNVYKTGSREVAGKVARSTVSAYEFWDDERRDEFWTWRLRW